MRGPPAISVIITCYDRKMYINQAIQSVLAQTLDRDLYEIIVVRNFDSPLIIDGESDRIERDVILRNGTLGEWIYEAVKYSHGDIIVFMDDDDLFHSEKLMAVLDVFTKNQLCIYYHNSQLKLKRCEITNAYEITIEGSHQCCYGNEKQELMWDIWDSGASFNLSSIAVRKKLIQELGGSLKLINMGLASLLFFKSICMEGELTLDTATYTIYRIHDQNGSPNATDDIFTVMRKMVGLSDRMVNDIGEIEKILQKCGGTAKLKPLYVYKTKFKFYLLISNPGMGRKEVMNFFLKSMSQREIGIWDLKIPLLCLYLLFPGTVRKILNRNDVSSRCCI